MSTSDLLVSFTEQVKDLCDFSVSSEIEFHIALSGGLDSIVLLHLFSRLRDNETGLMLKAHHINHGLSTNAVTWSDFCAQVCKALNIDFSCTSVSLQKESRTSIEALARDKRYACLKEKLSQNDYLVSAHHQDDQLETVLLALKRGSGNTGLQGIRSKQSLSKGYLIRPLLSFSRLQLEEYAEKFSLQWIEDESNQDQVFDRNYVRHTISPLLKDRWPSIAKTVARSASICQEQQTLLDEIAQVDFSLSVSSILNQQVLKIDALKGLSVARRNNVLRYWFKKNNLSYPSLKQILAIWTDIVLASEDASPSMKFKEVTLRRYRNHLYLCKEKESSIADEILIWQGEPQICLLGGKVKLTFDLTGTDQNALRVNPDSKVEICFRRHLSTKLTCTPMGRSGSRSIKKLLHEYHIAPWLRDGVPFILIDGVLQQAVGLWQCEPLPGNTKSDNYLTISFA